MTGTVPAADTDEVSGPEPRPSRRRARRAVVAIGVVAAVAAAGTALAVRPWGGGDTDPTPERQPESTVRVQRESLTSGLRLDGKLGHGPAEDVTAQGQGTFTKLPKADDTIKVGKPLYEVDAEPVVLFRGSRPFWRELAKGVSDGPDVKQLERNLTDLGHAHAGNLTVDEEFTEATAAAVKRWQESLGLEETGRVELGRVVVLPHRVVRVQEVVAKPGGTAGSGSEVLKVTTPDVYATVELAEEQIAQLAPGSKVTVELDAGGSLRGKVTSIGRDPGEAEDEGGQGAPGGGESKSQASIRLTDQKKAQAALDAARPDVTVTVPDQKVDDVLVVPVTALLAMAGGGYGVEVVRAGGPELVPVEVGLIVKARVQITGEVKEGDRVVIPG